MKKVGELTKMLGELTNDELLARLRSHVRKGHAWHAELIAYLVEVEDRRLDRLQACTSIWDFCIRKLGMSESEAQRRIGVVRIVRSFPHVLGYIERGDIGICSLYALRKHLRPENVDDLLREACGKSTREVEEMVAARFPRPDVRPTIEPVAIQASLPAPTTAASGAVPAWSLSLAPAGPSASVAFAPSSEVRPRIEPLSATRYRIELTVSAETKATIERIKDLMRHRNPSGDLEIILDASLELLLAKLEKERLGKTSRPRKVRAAEVSTQAADVHACAATQTATETLNTRSAPAGEANNEDAGTAPSEPKKTEGSAPVVAARRVSVPEAAEAGAALTPERKKRRSGYKPRDVVRAVFARDGEQCTYVDAEGNRCPARGHLELDHIHPKALGGKDTVDNLRVRCRAHNALYAEQVFGREHIERRIYLQRCKSEASQSGAVETLARALRALGFREPEVRRALGILETKLDAQATSLEAMLREALRLLT